MIDLSLPVTDPTPIFEIFRGCHATELLTAAVQLGVFAKLENGPRTVQQLRVELELEERPAMVLITALRAFGLVAVDAAGRLTLPPLAREHLVPGRPLYVGDYVGLAAETPGVKTMVACLKSNRPVSHRPDDGGAAFIYREGIDSAMEKEASARRLTLALAGRARNVAPVLARCLPLDSARLLLDVGGGTGLYSIACLQRQPRLRAIVWDRPEVLKVAEELARTHGVADRLECRAGDMFRDPVPAGADLMLLSNILHDWDVPECRQLVNRCATGLSVGGRLLVHDVFLNDTLDGPVPVAVYSAALFMLTEGRAYSGAEYRRWFNEAGLKAKEPIMPTLIHAGVLMGTKQ